MQRFIQNHSACPVCGRRSGQVRGGRAKAWKALPIGRRYACLHCDSRIVRFFGGASVVTEHGFFQDYAPETYIDFSLYSGGELFLNRSSRELTQA